MKPYKQIIYVLGDVHGEFKALNGFLSNEIRCNAGLRSMVDAAKVADEELEVLFFCCGDFAFHWPYEDNSEAIKNKVGFIKDGYVKIYFVDGNHEDHDQLDQLEQQHPDKKFHEVAPCVFYASFGAVLELQDGTNVLFCGGAESCDAADRTPHLSWWPQEGIDDRDMMQLPDPITQKIDWVISHTAPIYFQHMGCYYHAKKNEQSRYKLEMVRQVYKPSKWFFGHFHDFYQGSDDGCQWMCLNYLGSGDKWYEVVPWPVIEAKSSKVLIVGDVHGVFSMLQNLIQTHNPALVLQCGDFGYWPLRGMSLPKNGFRNVAGDAVPVFWADGNHENHWRLIDLVNNSKELGKIKIGKDIFYMPRGTTLELPDGRVVLFVGGANSIDQHMRVIGESWFPQEILTIEDFEKMPDCAVDIVISHTAPQCVVLPPQLDTSWHDPSRRILDMVLEKYRPAKWFCAHFHIPFRQTLLEGACQFYALGTCGEPGWFMFLDEEGER